MGLSAPSRVLFFRVSGSPGASVSEIVHLFSVGLNGVVNSAPGPSLIFYGYTNYWFR